MRSDSERLADILDAVQRIRRHVKAGDRQRFQHDEVLQNAVLRWFEIIGEASRGLTDQFRHEHQQVPWREISEMRNRVTHGYFDIDLDVVWNTIMNDLPASEDTVARQGRRISAGWRLTAGTHSSANPRPSVTLGMVPDRRLRAQRVFAWMIGQRRSRPYGEGSDRASSTAWRVPGKLSNAKLACDQGALPAGAGGPPRLPASDGPWKKCRSGHVDQWLREGRRKWGTS